MKIPVVILAASLVACSPQNLSNDDQLMDEIEGQVRLPAGASTLSEYSRHYVFDENGAWEMGKGKVFGIYLRPLPSRADIVAGSRHWHKALTEVPYYNDGGCLMVTVVFDPTERKVERTFCNGNA